MLLAKVYLPAMSKILKARELKVGSSDVLGSLKEEGSYILLMTDSFLMNSFKCSSSLIGEKAVNAERVKNMEAINQNSSNYLKALSVLSPAVLSGKTNTDLRHIKTLFFSNAASKMKKVCFLTQLTSIYKKPAAVSKALLAYKKKKKATKNIISKFKNI